MRWHHAYLDVGFNPKTKTIIPMNLEKLSKPIADFVRHLNFVFSGTPYGISSVIEGKYSQNGLLRRIISGVEGNNCLDIGINLYKRRREPTECYEEGFKYIGIMIGEDYEEIKLMEFEDRGDLKDFEDRIKDYDFSKIKEMLG
ncbi:Uncharacterised protein [uncultured archaeon]|nr:Uncharacterised protein [uncultured archaeon]